MFGIVASIYFLRNRYKNTYSRSYIITGCSSIAFVRLAITSYMFFLGAGCPKLDFNL